MAADPCCRAFASRSQQESREALQWIHTSEITGGRRAVEKHDGFGVLAVVVVTGTQRQVKAI